MQTPLQMPDPDLLSDPSGPQVQQISGSDSTEYLHGFFLPVRARCVLSVANLQSMYAHLRYSDENAEVSHC